MYDRLHPESLKTLEQLIKLHGAEALIGAIRTIDSRLQGSTPRLLSSASHRGNSMMGPNFKNR